MGDQNRRINVDRQRTVVRERRPFQAQGAGLRPRRADRCSCFPDVAGERVDSPGHRRVAGHSAEPPRLPAQHRDVSRAVTTHRKCHRQIQDDLAGVVHCAPASMPTTASTGLGPARLGPPG